MCVVRFVWSGIIKKGRLRKLPPFLIWFGVVCIVGAFVTFSISQLPWGLGSLCREIISATLLVLVFALTLSILHLFITIMALVVR